MDKVVNQVASPKSGQKKGNNKMSVYDGGRATQWARKQLRNLRDNQATAHRLKLESMFSFLPKKLLEVVQSDLLDSSGNPKNQIIPRPSKKDFHGVLVMADLVKSTNLSEEMEARALDENCGGALDAINETQIESDRKGSIYIGEGSKSSHSAHTISHKAVKKQAQKLRDAQNDAGKLGAERLRTVLTKYFKKLVGVTMSHGGDVVRIAGDAIISIFEDETKSIKNSLTKAQAACLDILNHYNDYEVDGNTLQVRLYMVIGSLSIFCVGGYQGRWEYMISGKPFADLKAMADLNEPGELCMSGDCWDILYSNTSRKLSKEYNYVDLRENGDRIGIKRTQTTGHNDQKLCVLLKVQAQDKPKGDFEGDDSDDDDKNFENSIELLTVRSYNKTRRHKLVGEAKKHKAFETRLKHFVPVPVMYHCDHQNIDLDWLEEAAKCSAMFVTFKETIHDLKGVQKVFLCLQRIILENSGIIKEFSMDDKGLVIVAGFGLQPNVVPNPAASACLAALQIQHSHTIDGSGSLCIGIATGHVFCAAIGSDFRREFALVGKVVNLAARLAFFARKLRSGVKSKKPASGESKDLENLDICVDVTTMNLAKSRIDFVSNKKINMNIRMSLSPQTFQCAQVEGLDAWASIFIKIFCMFRDGCLEPENGKALKSEEYDMIKYAYTKYIPGNLSSLDVDKDTVAGRTFFLNACGDRFLKDHKESLFLINFLMATNITPVERLNNIGEDESFQLTRDLFIAAINILNRVSPIALVVDDCQWCDKNSLNLIREIVIECHDEVLVICCSKTGNRHLPDMRLHVPRIKVTTDAANFRNTMIAANAFAGGFGGLGALAKKTQAREEEEKAAPAIKPMKPIPPKIGQQRSRGTMVVKSPRKSIVERRQKLKLEAEEQSKNQVVKGRVETEVKIEEDLNHCVMDKLVIELENDFPNIDTQTIQLGNLDFNETIALTSHKMGADSICNITAAAIYGHTQGNPSYVAQFSDYLVSPSDGEEYGGPVQSFDEDLKLSKETTWTLKNPRVPENFLSHVPAGIMDEIRIALKSCTAQQMWILKVMSVVGGSDCPIFLLEELLEDAVLNTGKLEADLCELIALGIIEQTLVKAIKPISKKGELSELDKLLQTQGGGNSVSPTEEDTEVSYLTYTFINVHCQTACYNMLSFSRRQELHISIAKWYEEKLGIAEPEEEEDSDDDGGGSGSEGEEKKAPGSAKSKSSKISKKKKANQDYLLVSKKYACFTIHHYFMASEVETSIAICELLGTMELQNFCGQYARKVLTEMPTGISDAVLHRTYPCIRWLQGVSSIINALKKGKIGFGTIAAGKIVSKKLDKMRQNTLMKLKAKSGGSKAVGAALGGLAITEEGEGEGGEEKVGLAGLAEAVRNPSLKGKPKPRKSPSMRMSNAMGTLMALTTGSSSTAAKEKEKQKIKQKEASKREGRASPTQKGSTSPLMQRRGSKAMIEKETKRKSKLANMSSAYGGNNAAAARVKKKDEEEHITKAAKFKGVSWVLMMSKTKSRIRQSIHQKLRFVAEDVEKSKEDALKEDPVSPSTPVRRQFSSGTAASKAVQLGISGMTSELPQPSKPSSMPQRQSIRNMLGMSRKTPSGGLHETSEFWKRKLKGYIEMLKVQASIRNVQG
ncbi:hypothetical protein TL16_g10755 [Triparma laevis f. inornata]|uniref:Guanylate cyclase domain-containing protein n=1 Tax=Triparma laevis f. inornata TaxID=1714386 RepID=A0A9W7BHQ9_9STRA|nr:hypothetical protein TL16_g10755 [Triparma laevis f. inornata]